MACPYLKESYLRAGSIITQLLTNTKHRNITGPNFRRRRPMEDNLANNFTWEYNFLIPYDWSKSTTWKTEVVAQAQECHDRGRPSTQVHVSSIVYSVCIPVCVRVLQTHCVRMLCVGVCMYVCICVFVWVYACVYKCVFMLMCLHICGYVCVCVCMFVFMYAFDVCVYACVCLCLSLYVFVFMHLWVYL